MIAGSLNLQLFYSLNYSQGVREWLIRSILPRETEVSLKKNDLQNKSSYCCFISPAQHTTTTCRWRGQQSKAREGFQSRRVTVDHLLWTSHLFWQRDLAPKVNSWLQNPFCTLSLALWPPAFEKFHTWKSKLWHVLVKYFPYLPVMKFVNLPPCGFSIRQQLKFCM